MSSFKQHYVEIKREIIPLLFFNKNIILIRFFDKIVNQMSFISHYYFILKHRRIKRKKHGIRDIIEKEMKD